MAPPVGILLQLLYTVRGTGAAELEVNYISEVVESYYSFDIIIKTLFIISVIVRKHNSEIRKH